MWLQQSCSLAPALTMPHDGRVAFWLYRAGMEVLHEADCSHCAVPHSASAGIWKLSSQRTAQLTQTWWICLAFFFFFSPPSSSRFPPNLLNTGLRSSVTFCVFFSSPSLPDRPPIKRRQRGPSLPPLPPSVFPRQLWLKSLSAVSLQQNWMPHYLECVP